MTPLTVPTTLQGISAALFDREREKASAKWNEAGAEIRDALREVSRAVVTLAEAEDLPAHGQAVTVRFADE